MRIERFILKTSGKKINFDNLTGAEAPAAVSKDANDLEKTGNARRGGKPN